MSEKPWDTIVAIAGITILAGIALSLGFDGIIYLTSVGIIAGLGGYPILKGIKDTYELKVVKSFLKVRK